MTLILASRITTVKGINLPYVSYTVHKDTEHPFSDADVTSTVWRCPQWAEYPPFLYWAFVSVETILRLWEMDDHYEYYHPLFLDAPVELALVQNGYLDPHPYSDYDRDYASRKTDALNKLANDVMTEMGWK